jgi:hypothetical protein
LKTWLWLARPSIQAVARLRPVKTGHTLLFGLLAQPSLVTPSWCLGTTWEPGWQPNCHQPLKRYGVWRQAKLPKHQVSSQYHPHKIKTNNLTHNFIYDFIITFIKSYNCSHNYNIISSSSQLQFASQLQYHKFIMTITNCLREIICITTSNILEEVASDSWQQVRVHGNHGNMLGIHPMFESMGMDVSHVLMGDMRSRINQHIKLKLNHHRQDIYMK